jgi:hypothetical protein
MDLPCKPFRDFRATETCEDRCGINAAVPIPACAHQDPFLLEQGANLLYKFFVDSGGLVNLVRQVGVSEDPVDKKVIVIQPTATSQIFE